MNIVSNLCAKCIRKTYINYMNVFYVSKHLSAKHGFFPEFQVSVFGKISVWLKIWLKIIQYHKILFFCIAKSNHLRVHDSNLIINHYLCTTDRSYLISIIIYIDCCDIFIQQIWQIRWISKSSDNIYNAW